MWYTKFIKIAETTSSLTFEQAADKLENKFPTYTSLMPLDKGPNFSGTSKFRLGLKDGRDVKYFNDTLDNLLAMNPILQPVPPGTTPTGLYTKPQIDEINNKLKTIYNNYSGKDYVIDSRGIWTIVVGNDSIVGTPEALIARKGEKLEHDTAAEPAVRAEYNEWIKSGGLLNSVIARIREILTEPGSEYKGDIDKARLDPKLKPLFDLLDKLQAGTYTEVSNEAEFFIPKATSFDLSSPNAGSKTPPRGNLPATRQPALPTLPTVPNMPPLVGVPFSTFDSFGSDPNGTIRNDAINGFIEAVTSSGKYIFKDELGNVDNRKTKMFEDELKKNFPLYSNLENGTQNLRDLFANIDLGIFRPTP